MRSTFKTVLMTAAFVVSVFAQAETHSKTIVVETPADLPALAQADSAAMYLHNTNDGRTFLYVENRDGSKLSILDVTDPDSIKKVAQTSIAVPSSFDFVRTLSDSSELIHYRDGSGFAILNLKKYNRPALEEAPQFNHVGYVQRIGETALISTGTTNNINTHTTAQKQKYVVMDISDSVRPRLLATVDGVEQQLSKPDTGTLFLLNSDGITVVRRLRVEEDHRTLLMQQTGN